MTFKVIDGLRTIEFGHPGESRKELNNFIINGNKRATAGLATEYLDENEPIEDLIPFILYIKVGYRMFEHYFCWVDANRICQAISNK